MEQRNFVLLSLAGVAYGRRVHEFTHEEAEGIERRAANERATESEQKSCKREVDPEGEEIN